jgi:hypothetical protein
MLYVEEVAQMLKDDFGCINKTEPDSIRLMQRDLEMEMQWPTFIHEVAIIQ